MQRTKTLLSAPEGVTESQIEGTYYWPEDNDEGLAVISTTNPNHVKVLKQHGYTVIGEVSIMPPAAVRGVIEVEELGRNGIAQALNERGVSFPQDATRAELCDIAESWNNARLRGRLGGGVAPVAVAPAKAVQPVRAPRATQAPVAPAEPAPAPPAEPLAAAGVQGATDFGDASYEELKGWLTSHGVVFPANTSKKRLKEMAEEAHAALSSKAAA